MMKIDRMAYAGGIVRDENSSILYHNLCVDKINEIIDVLNARETPKEKERTLWINENYEVVEFCCESMKKNFERYYNIIPNCFYRLERTTEPYFIQRKLTVDTVYHFTRCPYCDAPIKCRTRAEEQITLNHQEQEQILKSLGELCENYKKYNGRRLDKYYGISRNVIPEIYSHSCNTTRKAIIRILNRFELPLLDSAPYSSLKRNIGCIIVDGEGVKAAAEVLKRK